MGTRTRGYSVKNGDLLWLGRRDSPDCVVRAGRVTHHGANRPLLALSDGARWRVKESRSDPRRGGEAVLEATCGRIG